MHTVSKAYWFSSAHRLEGHPKCGRMHGHNYKVEVEFTSSMLNSNGMIIDFGRINDLVDPLTDFLDHRYIISEENIGADCPYYNVATGDDIVLLPRPSSTAENIASWFAEEIIDQMEDGFYPHLELVEVRVWETHKAYATYQA